MITVKLVGAAIFLLVFLTGCFAMPVEAPILPPPVISVPVVPTFSTTPVARGNVQMERTQMALYMPVREERLTFDVADVPILGIFVAHGDTVQAGDIIAALYMPEIQNEIYQLGHRRTRLEMELRQINERHQLALSIAETSGEPVDDMHFIENRASTLAELAIIDRHIEYLRIHDEARYLRASFDGVITRVAAFEEGMTSVTWQVIAIVSDSTYTAFVIRGRMAQSPVPGQIFTMIINDNDYLVQVVDPDEFGFTRNALFPTEYFLIFLEAPPVLQNNTMGMVQLASATAYDVLYIPRTLLRQVEDRTFVFVIENGLRTVRNVEIGLEGNTTVEIVSGLAEGELVIR